jgi:hypothetical protein
MKEAGLPIHGEAIVHDVPGLIELVRTSLK